MSVIRGLPRRILEPEVMDDPALDRDKHIAALRGLARLNFMSASVGLIWRPILRLAKKTGVRRLRVLDIATGSGDLPVGLWQKSKRTGLVLDLCGVDVSDKAVEAARQRAEDCRAPVQFSKFNALEDPIPSGFDVVMCSLFLHHLKDPQALGLLGRMKEAAGRMVLVNDLRRGRAGLLLAHLAAQLFTRSPVVHVDGPLSVKASFTMGEMRALAEAAGLEGARIERRWPFRFLLRWTRC